MHRQLLHIIEAILAAFCLAGCHTNEEYDNDNSGNFDALWTALDQHYCFFGEKDIDWDSIYNVYRPMVNEDLTSRQLFAVCAAMVNELKDGHTNLSSGFETSYYRKWWSDYPENFSDRLIEQYYFNFEYKQLGNVIYGMLPQNVGYIQIPSFSSGLSENNISWVLSDLLLANGLIIDLRNNGGGDMSYAEAWVRHFILEKTTVGYMRHKTGPGHEDFSDPYPIEFDALTDGYIVWRKPVVILTNRSTFSAANYLVMAMKSLPHVKHAGATTGGGSGMPLSLELPCGWGIRMSAVSVLDADGVSTDSGIVPEYEVELSAEEALKGHDTMLDYAIKLIS